MAPQEIVRTAIAEKLEVIAITDYNDIRNVSLTIAAAEGLNLFVIPGIELSTPQGHILSYLPDVESLEKFFEKLILLTRTFKLPDVKMPF